VAGRIALSVLDPLFLFPEVEGRKRLERLFEVNRNADSTFYRLEDIRELYNEIKRDNQAA
jgi:hypothetical protein